MITIFKYLHPKNWSLLGKQYDKKDINFVLLKPKILLSQLAVKGFLASLIHFVVDLSESSGMTAITLDILSGVCTSYFFL
ncbi:MAG: hypothetical protein IIB82_10355 [Bacteroidetes bacterium]|nr:hypothetical protein [Bacteroidota bacterium]